MLCEKSLKPLVAILYFCHPIHLILAQSKKVLGVVCLGNVGVVRKPIFIFIVIVKARLDKKILQVLLAD